MVRPGPVSGVIRAPSSKSYTHRALVLGHLSGRTFRIYGALDSDDTRATATALGRLGTPVHRAKEFWEVSSRPRPARTRVRVDCGESGTTLRFVCALAGLSGRTVRIDGRGRLPHRPIDELLDALRGLGAECRHVGRSGLPIEIRGPIRGGPVRLDASETSQFASALLLALPTVDEGSTLELTGRIVSAPYIAATLAVLERHGICIERRGRLFRIPGGQVPRGSSFRVPGDASSAAYFWTAAAVGGGSVRVVGVADRWPQADLAMLDILESAGASVSRRSDGATVRRGTPRPFHVNLTDSPDLFPLAGILAATIPGDSRLEGAEHVALKESDRRESTARLARVMGARAQFENGALRIRGTSRPRAFHAGHLSDHRLVMSAAIGALAGSGDSSVGEREAVRKSYPGFWEAFFALSGGGARR